MPNPCLPGLSQRGHSIFHHSAITATWPWEKTRASGEVFAKRIAQENLQIGHELAEGNALPPPPEVGTTLRPQTEPIRLNTKMWNTFRKTLKKDYNMNEGWVDARAGPLKSILGGAHHLRKYLQSLNIDKDKLSAYVRDIREATVRAMNDVSKHNELQINDGVFRRFLTEHVPEIDGKLDRKFTPEIDLVSGQDPDDEDLVTRLTAWLQ